MIRPLLNKVIIAFFFALITFLRMKGVFVFKETGVKVLSFEDYNYPHTI